MSLLKSCRNHLDAVDESYSRHLVEALRISGSLATASLACAFHAMVPALFRDSASRRISTLYHALARRGIAARR